ncbi:serine/threonine-protein kinase [Streptomyces thermospinosisporus]|uniref:non-specific serine/threonine protein kinase n=1 Tax=Streptomyces thermospinosisporus TaxID=161482 RepID=A0ABN1YJE1_9ACTN
MGRVWRAADEILHRQVAVKEMRLDGSDAEDSRTRRERTLREARATARIDHPNVVRIYDVVDEGERLWIVMELVAGRSLERILAEDGRLTPRETARIGLGLVAALREVHARGVLHRDIKPGNVLVDRGGRVVLTDFGIAALQDAKALTMAGMLVGSPDYMAPERVSGRPQGPPSDIFSLGATLCAALSGASPFTRPTTLATLHAVLYEDPELPETAGPLRDTLEAALHKDPARRPSLSRLESTLGLIAHPPPSPTVPTPAPTLPARPEPDQVPTLPARPEPAPDPEPPPATVVNRPQSEPDPPEGRRAAGRTESPPRERDRRQHRPPDSDVRPDSSIGSRTKPHRRTVLAAAAAAAVAATTVLAVLLTDTGADPSGSGGGTETSAPDPSPTVQGTSRPPSLPPGARREAGGFAWTPPVGWRRDVKTGAEVHYTSPDGRQELVAKSALARGDLLQTWQTSERNAHQGRNYRKIRLEETTFRGHPAVVWEYTFTLEGTPWHARLLGFNQDGKSYQINTWYQPGTEDEALRVYEKTKKSFTVL